MRVTWVVSCAVLACGCGRFGFASEGASNDGGGDDGSTTDGGPDARLGDDGTGVIPAACATASAIICDDFERVPLTDYMGAFDGYNSAAGDLALSTAHAYTGSTALQIHLEGTASARAILYKNTAPGTNVRVSYAMRFSTMPDGSVFMSSIYLQDTAADQQIQIFANLTVPGTFTMEAELLGSAGLIRDTYSDPLPFPVGRWFVVEYDLDLSGATPVVSAVIDGTPAPAIGGAYFVDPFGTTNESVYIGTGFSEGGSIVDYLVDDVAVIAQP